MKKVFLLLLLSFSFMSFQCEADEQPTEQTCECYKETWVRYMNGDWYHNGNTSYYSNDCTDNGDEVGQPYSGQGWDVKYIVRCE